MTEIKNLLFQPVTLHRAGGAGLHLGPRERAAMPEEALSEDIRRAERRGVVSLAPVQATAPQPIASPEPEPLPDEAHPRRKKDK